VKLQQPVTAGMTYWQTVSPVVFFHHHNSSTSHAPDI